MTINWFRDVSEPRILAGATSAKYVGTSADAPPTAIPRTTRLKTKVINSGEKAEPSDPIRKIKAANMTIFLRPNLSDRGPIDMAPIMAPSRTEETTIPSSRAVKSRVRLTYKIAPEITPVS